ncbi:GTP-binding protein [Mesorhizobium sp. CAU 1741]|uniref:CobW family GTP-binding protein n=1 Tax=Mesorhizobium sp. CAU 1741 TaxID=3140366 RepID=UPI00325B2166
MAAQGEPLPIILLTGFLGSGKTTLLNRLVKSPGLSDTAVIVNEFGEISIDHLMIDSAIENTLVLESGCICCTIRGDLVDTLRDLVARAQSGEIPSFSRVIVETTGLAEPAPIIQTIVGDPMLVDQFRLGLVVTTVDAQMGIGEIERFPEAVKQIAAADLLLVTKSDLASKPAVEALSKKVASMNPGAEMLRTMSGDLDPDILMSRLGDPGRAAAMIKHLDAAGPDAGHDHHGHDHDAHGAHFHADGNDIRTFSIEVDEPLDEAVATLWIQSLLSLRGQDILRLKGVLWLKGRDEPVLVQCVQHVSYPPVALAAWPEGQRRTQIVFITRGIGRAGVMASLTALREEREAA